MSKDPAAPARILLAEDDHDMRELLAEVLRGDGHEVVEVSHGAALLDALSSFLFAAGADQTRRPDLIISDVRMPLVTGMDLLAGLRSSSWTVPIVLITAFADEDLRERAAELGASALLDKPFDPEALRSTVRTLLKL